MPTVKDSVRAGWEIVKKNPWMVIGAFLLTFIISGVLNGIVSAILPVEGPSATPWSSAMNFFLSMAMGAVIEIGLVTFVLKAQTAVETLSLHDLWNPQPFLRYLIAQVLIGIIVIIGLLLLIIPGIIAGLALMFTPYLIVDKHVSTIEAMKESVRMTQGHRWELFLLMITIVLLNIAGILALFVGLLVTMPVSMLAIAHVYRHLENAAVPITT